MKACLVELNRDIHSSKVHEKYELFVSKFPHVKIAKKRFIERQKAFTTSLVKKKWDTDDKADFLSIFGAEKWNNLDSEAKLKHDFNCQKCSSYELFPALTKKKSSKSIDVVNEPNNDIKLTLALPGTTAKGVQKDFSGD